MGGSCSTTTTTEGENMNVCKKLATLGSAAIAALITLMIAAAPVGAATGDLVASVVFSNDCSLGVGVAYDGTNLWYSCYGGSPNLHRASPTTGVVDASYSIPASGLGALSYDATRNAIWAGAGSDAVYRIDLDAGKNVVATTLVFHTGDYCGLDDGLAFDANNVADPNDDVIYYSDDCWTTTIVSYDLSGGVVESFPFIGTGGHNSGLAIGGQLLYEADVFNPIQSVWVIDKVSKALQFTFSTNVPNEPNFHPEDLECDTNTFAGIGKHVMWSKEAYAPARAHAFEIPFGTCGIGGQPAACGDGNLDSGEECDDGNTADGDGCSHDCKVENQPPDCSNASPSPSELWPPNHQMVNVAITGVTDPDGDPVSVAITDIAQDEPLNTVGDGNTCPDAVLNDDGSADLRAERSGTPKVPGDGRVYHVSFTASDGNGGECTDTVTVCVPHDQRPGHVCVDQGPIYDSTTCP